MFKFIITIVALYLLYKLIFKPKKDPVLSKEEPLKSSGKELVKDPICGTFVPKNSDIRVKIGERVECFCSYECRDKFLKQLESQKKK